MGHHHCNDKKYHSHSYCGETSFNDCHVHHFGGISCKEDYDPCHTHILEGHTTYNNGHTHDYKIKTGPPIPQPKGGHIHYFQCDTKCEDGHEHCMKGFTSAD